MISIHALRGEGDGIKGSITQALGGISIHALRGEGDPDLAQELAAKWENFYPRPPWGGRREQPTASTTTEEISIHALRGEGDTDATTALNAAFAFLSTPSVGRATSSASTPF